MVNREHLLSPGYAPLDLVSVNIPFQAPLGHPKRMLRKKAACAAECLFERAEGMGIELTGISGYRSYERQKQLQNGSSSVAPPGSSEHQTGLALDVSCPALSYALDGAFGETREGQFLEKYAPLYGFILRYPKGKENITGYPWEPWHIRYVTKSLSLFLTLTGMVLEEYHPP